MKRMNAAVLTGYRKVEWKTVDIPEISGNEVLVKVGYACICGSDQHVFLGEFHPRTSVPLIQGHEFAGTIVKTGPTVINFKEGDRVAVDPIIWCGHCPACKIHHYPACSTLKLVGIDLDGGFSEYMKVPETMLYRVTDKISDKHAALVEVLSIGFHACNRAKIAANERIVIWGAGKVGQSILQAVKTKTSNTVIMVDILDERLAMAKKAYNDIHVINAGKTDTIEMIRELTGGEGVDLAFEAVGHYKEISGAVNPVRGCIQAIRGAGRVCTLGLAADPTPILMKELIWKEGTIITSRVSHGEFAETIENMNRGTLKPDAIVTDILHPSRTQEAFEMLEKEPDKHLKILLKFNE
jgi:threonine dehydrogenase-like Zn-dependent dehydrogenase